jgi:hypothetical protein
MTSEADEQREFVAWYRATYPQYAHCLRVSQTGGFRGKGRQGAIRAAHQKAMGVITGEADIAILLPRGGYGCLVVEHKRAGGAHKVTPAQQYYLNQHTATGNCAASTRGLEALKAAVSAYIEGSSVAEKHDRELMDLRRRKREAIKAQEG